MVAATNSFSILLVSACLSHLSLAQHFNYSQGEALSPSTWLDTLKNGKRTTGNQLPILEQVTVYGKDVVLNCGIKVKNSSLLKTKWIFKGEEVSYDGDYDGFYETNIVGLVNLRIDSVSFYHQGEYECIVETGFRNYTRKTMLWVKEYTRIVGRTCGYKAPPGASVTLNCFAMSDPSLPVTMSWTREDGPIDTSESRFRVAQAPKFSLTISKLLVSDSGNYTCQARTSADNATSQLQLTVLDVPNQPTITNLTCRDRSATVHWNHSGDNEFPILFHRIQYSTTFQPDNWTTVVQSMNSGNIFYLSLSPWANYTFRVISTNWLGPSRPSHPSKCPTTPPYVPFNNPGDVKVQGRFPNSLAISWTVMPEIEHNAPGFSYQVKWKVTADSEGSWNTSWVKDWRTSELVLPNQPPNTTYLVSVQAFNSVGASNIQPEVIEGFSGQINLYRKPLDWLQILGMLLLILVPMVIILILSISYILERERRKQLEIEIKEFIEGNENAERESGTLVEKAYYKPFTSSLNDEDVRVDYDRPLGSGNFGNVFSGMYDGKSVAVKVVKPGSPITAFQEFFKELKIMVYIGKHDHIVHFIGAVTSKLSEKTIFAVLEFSPIGSLENYLRKHVTYDEENDAEVIPMRNIRKVNPLLLLETLLSFCRQIARGMQHLVDKTVIHGDLATRNVLVFHDDVVKISDFGFSRNTYGNGQYKKNGGTDLPFRWAAIETLRRYEFSHKADVWSYGVTVWEIFTLGNCPFSICSFSEKFMEKIEKGELELNKPDLAPDDIYNHVILKCRNLSPDARPSFHEIIKYLNDFEHIPRTDNYFVKNNF